MKALPWHEESLRALAAQRARMPHALLVHGPAGIGKVEFARALGRALLCEAPRDGLACGACASCHWFDQGNHPDYREVVPEAAEDDAEEPEAAAGGEKSKSVFIKIDQVRALGDFITLSTHRDGFRVLVMHPAESLQPAAGNALLKTLEEPPPRTVIVLVSDRPGRLLATLRSRCRRVALALPPAAQALAWLRSEGIEQPEAALAAAGGAPLLARELAAPDEAQFRGRLVAELSRGAGADATAFAAAVDRARVERFVFWLQTWIQDLVRVRLAAAPRHHRSEARSLEAKARSADLAALFALDRELVEARRLADHPLNARLLAEHLLMAYNRATLGTRP